MTSLALSAVALPIVDEATTVGYTRITHEFDFNASAARMTVVVPTPTSADPAAPAGPRWLAHVANATTVAAAPAPLATATRAAPPDANSQITYGDVMRFS